jgi:uncharacterized protein (DUF697 family)
MTILQVELEELMAKYVGKTITEALKEEIVQELLAVYGREK